MTGVLDGVRILDFGRYIAGPYAACLLGDLGAEVIRVERVGGGEDRFVVPLAGEEGGAMFLQLNRNKQSLTLDPSSPEGRAILEKLVATADVVMVNVPPQTQKAMGLDYESLTAIKPDIILSSMSAFGSTGPWSHRIGFDGIAQAMSGLCYMTGQPGQPQKAYGPWADFAAANYAAFATLAAIHHKHRTGEGQHVEAPLLRAALVPATALLIEQGVKNLDREPTGNRAPSGAPADMFHTRDGSIIVQVVSQALFRRWARLMGEDIWLTDPRFRDDASRSANWEVLGERMNRWCAERTTAEAMAELEAANLPAGPVLKPQEVLDHPHLAATGAFHPLDYPGLPVAAPMLATPFSMSATPPEFRSRPPTTGEHTTDILASLGIGADEITRLRASGIV